MTEALSCIKKRIKNAKSALVVSHVDPDGDSIGSMNAMAILLAYYGLAVDIYSQDSVPKIYRFLPGSDKVKQKLEPNKKYDLLIAVDASDIKRLGDKFNPRAISRAIINIDHHPDNTNYADCNYVEGLSSTAELIYKLIKYLKMKITHDIADNLYVALITDTGNFRYENTSISTFAMAQDLLKAGVKTHDICTKIYDNKSLTGIRVGAAVMSKMQISPDRKIAWAVVTKEIMAENQAKSEDLVGLIDMIRQIEGIEVAILFREEYGKIKVNFRSKTKTNVSEVARRFGGGGHYRAAGAVLEMDINMAQKLVIHEVKKYIAAAQFLI
jgi:phosphoesterase RecJ-like protein